MAWNKVWLGTTSTDFAVSTNWQKISIRNSGYLWTQKGATGEYYVRATGPVDPAFGAKPGSVYINGTLATEGTLGALAVGQWCWGDPDTLGYSTVTVRVTANADPDTLATDYVQFQAVPNGADSVTISGLATNGIASNADQSALSAAAWRIEAAFRDKPLGTQAQPLRITPSSLVIDGGGSSPWYIDIGSANITVDIRSAPTASTGLQGLYLKGSNIASIYARGGVIGIAMLPGDTATVGTMQTIGGQAVVTLGAGVTLTTARTMQGSIILLCGATTMDCQGGNMETQLAAVASGNVFVKGGTFTDRSTGTHAAVTMDGGTLDTLQLTGAKTFTTFKHNAGTFKENVDLLAITTRSEADYAGVVSRARAA
jgi:hypothetical protein